jgi:hypothetical protein
MTPSILPTIYGPPASAFFPGGGKTLLEHTILTRANGSVTPSIYGPIRISSDLPSLTGAIESTFVLVPRQALPKITQTPESTFFGRTFRTDSGLGLTAGGSADDARKTAAAWLAVAQVLEGEEKAAADEAKKKAAAEQQAADARRKRLDELATEYFDDDFMNLGFRKARIIEDTYKLEQQLADAD